MNTELVTLELPANMHEQLQALATAEETDVVSYLEQLVADAYQRERWLKTLDNLYQLIQDRGGRVLRVMYNQTVTLWRIVSVHFDRKLKGKLGNLNLTKKQMQLICALMKPKLSNQKRLLLG